MKAGWRAQRARLQGMSLANLLRESKGDACPEWHLDKEILEKMLGIKFVFISVYPS